MILRFPTPTMTDPMLPTLPSHPPAKHHDDNAQALIYLADASVRPILPLITHILILPPHDHRLDKFGERVRVR